ncbi:hypothetical protein EI94DRAFT_1816322 [Lactarius quietus]|nr:hypothetical protein EI94DRAFT_1816322 [Lactarius quietus]
MPFSHDDELTTPIYHRVRIDAINRGSSRAPVRITQSLSSTALLRFLTLETQPPTSAISASPFLESLAPYLFVETTRVPVIGVIGSSSDASYPSGNISIDPIARDEHLEHRGAGFYHQPHPC